MGKTKELYEDLAFGEPEAWFSEAQKVHLHWMEQEFEYYKKHKNDNNTRR